MSDDAFFSVLEQKLANGTISAKEKIALANWLADAVHDEDRAVQLFHEMIDEDPRNVWARYWLAYFLYVRYPLGGEEALLKAKSLLEVRSEDEDCSSASMVLLLNIENLLRRENNLGEEDIHHSMEVVQKATDMRPEWPNHHHHLASLYQRTRQYDGELVELQRAQSLLYGKDVEVDPLDFDFEELVTGRTSQVTRHLIEKRLRQITGTP